MRPIARKILLQGFFGLILLGWMAVLLPDTAQAQWAISGTNIYNTNSGNVGIGTSAPTYKLHVNGSLYTSGLYTGSISGLTSVAVANSILRISGGDLAISDLTYLKANGNIIVNSGNIGVGTSNPLARLHLYGNNYTLFGPNSSWGAYLAVGGNGHSTNYASVAATNGNLHLDAAAGGYGLYLNYYAGTGGIHFGNGATGETGIWTNAGNVGIGTVSPGANLDVGVGATQCCAAQFPNISLDQTSYTNGQMSWLQFHNAGEAEAYIRLAGGGPAGPRAGQRRLEIGDSQGVLTSLTVTGNVGIGTTAPGARLHILGTGAGDSEVARFSDSTAGGNAYITIGDDQGVTGSYLLNDKTNQLLRLGMHGDSTPLVIKKGGNVGIGTTTPSTKLHVVGDVTVTGNIASTYQDVAEWVPAARSILPGTVVILDSQQTNQVVPSSKSYDTKVAGVVSDMPGILLGKGGEGKVKVATTGRVKVKVDAGKKPIQVGDLLVTGDKEGVAMKSEPLDLGGVPIHRPGTLIGKALEPLEKGEGEILVLLSLQ